ncbi:hypothetical protein JEQ12_009379 [Ovis aries]|uniref:Uncharacterized protein n=1 Tax=Ovis aries TaxID=9940 RepID=A0A836D5Q0_SHEEP|nr:hypothetical protein JEQ12_009379 [Ovis aries]
MLKLFCSLYSMGHRKGHKGEEKVQILTVGLGPARFQLQYMGHYLVHDERKDPDPRVQDFVPDNWQGEPLDIVDKNKSAVIMAPKSSGKTYTSYCCMERVLHEGNERMVIITSVCGKRSKCSCLWVLITVPACFEILLLAPYHQVWVTRIRYVIFDEQETNDIPKTEQCQKSVFQRARLERVILWEAEISEMKKSLGKHYEVPPDCIYTEHSVVDSQMKTATSTLALGVNMPCHMSAHAGRHGEDLTGSVFFGNIPLPKTERPLRSNVPELNDQFPLSLSLVLRRMLLGAKADDKEDASAKVVLKALPEDLATGAEEHNDRVQNVASFLLTISKLAAMRKECQLPLSETGKAENVRAV